MRRVRVVAEDTGAVLGLVEVAETARTRMVGLLGRDSLPRGAGLVLRPCAMIHTCFMRFPVDVLFTDRRGLVLRSIDTLRPFRLAWGGLRAHQAVELPAGTLRGTRVTPGATVRLEPLP